MGFSSIRVAMLYLAFIRMRPITYFIDVWCSFSIGVDRDGLDNLR